MASLKGNLSGALAGGHWLNRKRLIMGGALLLGFELAAFVFLIAGTHGWIVPLAKPATTDFVSFYAAGRLADAHHAAAAYVRAAHFAAEQRATAPGIDYVYFFYPPVFLLLCAPLARLPYLAGFMVFETGSLLPCLAALKRIATPADQPGGWLPWLVMLAYPALYINFGLGQNGFVTAALFAGASLLIDRRPALAGILFGALCYKPHFGLLVPVALIAGRQWRGFGAAALTVAALVLLSAGLFGWPSWRGFWIAITASHTVYESGKVDFAAFVSLFGALRLLGFSKLVAYGGQAPLSLAAAAVVAWIWRGGGSLPVRAASLAAATLAAVPLSLFYDLMLAGVAIAWMVRAGRMDGFLPWEKTVLAANFIVPLLIRGVGRSCHLPLGVLAILSLLLLCARRAAAEFRARKPDPARPEDSGLFYTNYLTD